MHEGSGAGVVEGLPGRLSWMIRREGIWKGTDGTSTRSIMSIETGRGIMGGGQQLLPSLRIALPETPPRSPW